MITPCNTPRHVKAREALMKALRTPDLLVTLMNSDWLDPCEFQDQEGMIDLCTYAHILDWDDLQELLSRLRKDGWNVEVVRIEAAEDWLKLDDRAIQWWVQSPKISGFLVIRFWFHFKSEKK